MNPLPQTETET